MILKKIFSFLSILLIFLIFSFNGVVSVYGDEDATTNTSEKCPGPDCISSSEFKINVGSITPTQVNQSGDTVAGVDSQTTINNFLENIITQLIIAFGVLALLVMTIGAGFMIIYHGQDELLTRGKSIFSYGLISLVVALSAGFLVQLTSYLLYGA